VSSSALVERVVHLGQQLLDVVREGAHVRVPVVLGVALQGAKHVGHYTFPVVHDEVDDVLVVPKEERPLCNLEVWRLDALRDLPEQLRQHRRKLGRTSQLQHFLQLPEAKHSLARRRLRPQLEETRNDDDRQRRVLLHKLGNAKAQLPMVARETLGNMKRQQGAPQEHLVFLLEREREAIDDGAKDFEQLCGPVVAVRRSRPLPLRLVHETVEGVGNGTADENAERHELPVDPVEDGLQVLPLPRVFRVKQRQQRGDKRLIYHRAGHLGVRLVGDDEAAEHFIGNLHMGPSRLQARLVILSVEPIVCCRPDRESTEEVG